MKKYIALSVFSLMLLAGCETENIAQNDTVEPEEEKIVIAATFYPLAEFARNVAGDKAEVIQIIPNGADPHEYEPTAKDLVTVHQSSLLLANGAHLDPWVDKIRPELEEKGIKVIVIAEHVDLLSSALTSGHKHEDEHENEDEHEHEQDPHFWLNPVIAIHQIELIQEALIELDPSNSSDYSKNANAYIQQLKDLDEEYRQKLSDCRQKTIITSHAAFGYLAQRYGFTQIGISGISPQEEPSIQKIAELADMAKSENIKYIYLEALASPRLSQTLASEVGAETLLLHPLGGLTTEDNKEGNNYITIMKSNLNNLVIGLECK